MIFGRMLSLIKYFNANLAPGRARLLCLKKLMLSSDTKMRQTGVENISTFSRLRFCNSWWKLVIVDEGKQQF